MQVSNAQVDAIESDEYFQKRSLKGGAVGWVLLVSLGVAYTVKIGRASCRERV